MFGFVFGWLNSLASVFKDERPMFIAPGALTCDWKDFDSVHTQLYLGRYPSTQVSCANVHKPPTPHSRASQQRREQQQWLPQHPGCDGPRSDDRGSLSRMRSVLLGKNQVISRLLFNNFNGVSTYFHPQVIVLPHY